MNTQHTITIDIVIPQSLLGDSIKHPDQIFTHFSDTDKKRIQDYVVDQLSDRDGGPELVEMQINTFKYDAGSGTGSFRLKFKISRRFCCSDTTGCNDDYIDFRFKYEQEILRAEGHYFQWSLNN